MFVTDDDLEQYIPDTLKRPSTRFWRAVTLSSPRPWFMLRHEVEADGEQLLQSTLFAWDTDLVDAMGEIPRARLKGVCRFDMSKPFVDGTQWLESIWQAAPDERKSNGEYLFRVYGEEAFVNAFGREVADRSDRHLLFRFQKRGRS